MTSTAQPTELLTPPISGIAGTLTGARISVRAAHPELAAEFVRRPALVARLREAAGAALALIVAPPGYGKTSLLSNWELEDSRSFIWLGPGRSGRPADDLDILWDRLRAPDARSGGCVVIDDAHLLEPQLLRRLVDALLGELPAAWTVALAMRTEPELPVGRLRAHRALVEVRMKDLAMTPAEASELLRLTGCDFEPAAVATLVARTEGWPAALYLAALSQREHPGPSDGIAGFRGDDHMLSEYVRDEVLVALPEELRSFAIRTSVLDELSASSCDWVLGEPGSAPVLATVARATELLRPLDRAHETYRWHPLFAETLRGDLRRLEPGLEARLHGRASELYRDQGDSSRAIEHACHAQDAPRAGELLGERILQYLTRGGLGQVRSWLERFTDERIADCPRLALCAALTSLAAGDTGRAEHWALRVSANGEPTHGADRTTAAALLVIRAVVARDGLRAMHKAAGQAYQLEPQASPWHPVCLYLQGVATYLLGDGARASTLLEHATELGGTRLPSITALSLAQRAMIAIEQHDWDLAGELTDLAAQMIRDGGIEAEPATALVFASCAASRVHQDRFDEAKRDLQRGIGLLAQRRDEIAWHGAELCLLLAHASLRLADVVGARTLLAQASRYARKTSDAAVFKPWFAEAWSYLDTLAETSLTGPSALTIAELRVLRFLPSHRSFREIAGQLGVSTNTVKTQAHAVYRKLDAASRSEAIERALQSGLLGEQPFGAAGQPERRLEVERHSQPRCAGHEL